MLKDNSTNVLNASTSVPSSLTVTSSASAQFESPSSVHDIISCPSESIRNQSSLSYSNIPPVNYPSSEGRMPGNNIVSSASATFSLAPTNGGMGINKYNLQQYQTTAVNTNGPKHQSLTATTQQQLYQAATPQFTSYGGIPFHHHPTLNMYSPVAAAHGIPTAEVDRFLMQQYPFATALELPFSALSMASGQPPIGASAGVMASTTQHQSHHHRTAPEQAPTSASYMDISKYQQQPAKMHGQNYHGYFYLVIEINKIYLSWPGWKFK